MFAVVVVRQSPKPLSKNEGPPSGNERRRHPDSSALLEALKCFVLDFAYSFCHVFAFSFAVFLLSEKHNFPCSFPNHC